MVTMTTCITVTTTKSEISKRTTTGTLTSLAIKQVTRGTHKIIGKNRPGNSFSSRDANSIRRVGGINTSGRTEFNPFSNALDAGVEVP